MAEKAPGMTPNTKTMNPHVAVPEKAAPKGPGCEPGKLGAPIKGFTGSGVRNAKV